MNEGNATQSKLNNNSRIHGARENSMLLAQTIRNDDNEEALAGAAAAASLLSPSANNLARTNIFLNSVRMKCYFHHEQNCFLDYFDDPILDDAVIYTRDIPFQDNEKEGRYI